jgi:hypothetical protein
MIPKEKNLTNFSKSPINSPKNSLNLSFTGQNNLYPNIPNTKASKDSTFLIEKIKKINKWSSEEDQKLLNLIKSNRKSNWKDLASNFPQKSYVQCYNRYQRIGKNFLKGSWSQEEDENLLKSFEKFGRRWNLLAKDMGNKRTSKQIRDRFMNVLDPGLNKRNFTKIEEKNLLHCFEKMGKSWTKISNIFPGRTGEMIKNKYFSMSRQYAINLPNSVANAKGENLIDRDKDEKEDLLGEISKGKIYYLL